MGISADLWKSDDGDTRAVGNLSIKATELSSRAPEDDILFPERTTSIGLLRARLSGSVSHHDRLIATIAYEQSARWFSGDAGNAGGGVLPSLSSPPYRLGDFDTVLDEGSTRLYSHELDRAFVAWDATWGQAIVGRQAIGLGRGVIFTSMDFFAPFSTLEVDREWRRGVDAARVELELSDKSSCELIGVFGESGDGSAYLGRIRGYLGNVDGELLFGRRCEDNLVGSAVSVSLSGAELHGEAVVFETPEEQPHSGPLNDNHLMLNALIGASYTFNIGNGITLFGEYLFSGLGMQDIETLDERLAQEDFYLRVARGDLQILGQHALGVQVSYPLNETWSSSLLVLQSPEDGSGVGAPALTWDISDYCSAVASAFVPWGERPEDGRLTSEYGGTPSSIFLQVNIYY